MNDRLTILCGDVLEKLHELPDESVQCCVTSPPFWGLRDYGTATWDGGDAQCDHSTPRSRRDDIREGDKQGTSAASRPNLQTNCKCGAKRIDAQLGLEKTPEEYVAKMVEVFREVRRVLRKDGTLWLNLGDSYFGGGRGGNPEESLYRKQATNVGSLVAATPVPKGCKPKDLVGIPWMVAFALRTDGWWLRSDIIWAKPNPMPESVTDRPTKSHEYIFLLTKSTKYSYDAEAIKEKGSWLPENSKMPDGWDTGGGAHGTIHRNGREKGRRTNKQRGHGRRHDGFNDRWDAMKKSEQCSGMRNKRDVWTIACAPYPEAHFATYPPDLIKPCIMAGSKAGDVVLDPFAGSGTTGLVSLELGRKAVLVELNPKYVALIEQRTDVTPGLALA